MGLLSKISAAAFAVPLSLSALLLRALDATSASTRRPVRRTVRPKAAASPARGKTAAATPKALPGTAEAMSHELGLVLDAHAGSRNVFRYLAHFERHLAKEGLHTLETMPTERLRRALAQFEAIVFNWSQTDLANLRSRMAVAVSARDSGAAVWVPAATLSKTYQPRPMPMLGRRVRAEAAAEFQASRQVEVEDDIGISRFEAAVDEWQLSERQALAAAAAQTATAEENATAVQIEAEQKNAAIEKAEMVASDQKVAAAETSRLPKRT